MRRQTTPFTVGWLRQAYDLIAPSKPFWPEQPKFLDDLDRLQAVIHYRHQDAPEVRDLGLAPTVYRCRSNERCTLLWAYRAPVDVDPDQRIVCHLPSYSIPGKVGQATSSEQGRKRYARDGANHWKAHTVVMPPTGFVAGGLVGLNCRHLHDLVISQHRIERDLGAGVIEREIWITEADREPGEWTLRRNESPPLTLHLLGDGEGPLAEQARRVARRQLGIGRFPLDPIRRD